MTREEAKKLIFSQWQSFLEDYIDYGGISEAYKMAIRALEQEPCENAISMSVIENIKAEINEFIKNPQFGDLSIGASCGAVRCLEIINRHLSGKESE